MEPRPPSSQPCSSGLFNVQTNFDCLTKKNCGSGESSIAKRQKTVSTAFDVFDSTSHTQHCQQIKKEGADLLATLKIVNDNAFILLKYWEWQGFYLTDLQRQFDENFANARRRFYVQIDRTLSLFELLRQSKKEIELLCSEPIAKFARNSEQLQSEPWWRGIWQSAMQSKKVCGENLEDSEKCEMSALNALGLCIEIAKGRSLIAIRAAKKPDTVQFALEYGRSDFRQNTSSRLLHADAAPRDCRFRSTLGKKFRAPTQHTAPGFIVNCEYSRWIAEMMRSKGLGRDQIKKETAQRESGVSAADVNAFIEGICTLKNSEIDNRVRQLQFRQAGISWI